MHNRLRWSYYTFFLIIRSYWCINFVIRRAAFVSMKHIRHRFGCSVGIFLDNQIIWTMYKNQPISCDSNWPRFRLSNLLLSAKSYCGQRTENTIFTRGTSAIARKYETIGTNYEVNEKPRKQFEIAQKRIGEIMEIAHYLL